MPRVGLLARGEGFPEEVLAGLFIQVWGLLGGGGWSMKNKYVCSRSRIPGVQITQGGQQKQGSLAGLDPQDTSL